MARISGGEKTDVSSDEVAGGIRAEFDPEFVFVYLQRPRILFLDDGRIFYDQGVADQGFLESFLEAIRRDYSTKPVTKIVLELKEENK